MAAMNEARPRAGSCLHHGHCCSCTSTLHQCQHNTGAFPPRGYISPLWLLAAGNASSSMGTFELSQAEPCLLSASSIVDPAPHPQPPPMLMCVNGASRGLLSSITIAWRQELGVFVPSCCPSVDWRSCGGTRCMQSSTKHSSVHAPQC